MKSMAVALCAVLGTVSAGHAADGGAVDGKSVAARFGALPNVEDMSLSPDGNKVAIISPYAGGQVVLIADLVAGGVPKPILRSAAKDGCVYRCDWSTSERVLCSAHGIMNEGGLLLGFTRTFAVNADGSKLVQLSARDSSRALGMMQDGGDVLDWNVPGKPGSILASRVFIPDRTIGTRLAQVDGGLGVELLDTVTLRRLTVEKPNTAAEQYISDGRGTIRIMGWRSDGAGGYVSSRVNYSYRLPGSRNWLPLAQAEDKSQYVVGFDPAAVDAQRNVVYGFDTLNGYRALYSIALDGSLKKDVVLAKPGIDIDRLIRIGRSARVVGASYVTDKRTAEYFDPALAKLRTALGKALPGDPLVDFTDANEGETRLLMVAASDINPGKTYVYDKATHHLEEVLALRPDLDGMKLAEMKPITYRASDGTMIPAYLTLPPGSSGKGLPAIVMPHGGPSARDEWGFDWMVQFYAARGYAVIQPNYRGSSGYGTEWYQKNGFQSWRTAVGDVNDAGRWLLAQGIAAPGKLAIVGWSYGGYAALQSAVLDPDLFRAIVAVAPVTDLNLLRSEAELYVNGMVVKRFVGEGPHLREGSPAQNAARFKAPVLIFHGDFDQNVAVEQSRYMEGRLKAAGKRVTYVEFPKLNHDLPDASARTRLLSESDMFLRANLGL